MERIGECSPNAERLYDQSVGGIKLLKAEKNFLWLLWDALLC